MSVHSFSTAPINTSYFNHGQVNIIKSVTSYMWVINDFRICRKKTGEVIDSQIISAGADGEHRWRILLYPRGRNEDHREYLSVYLFLISCNESKIDVQVKFSILNEKNEEFNERKVEHKLHRGKGAGCSDFIKRDILFDKSNLLLPDGQLTIICEITTGTYNITSANTNKIVHELSVADNRLSDDLERLLENEKYSDVTLVVADREFHVHRNIIDARIPLLGILIEKKLTCKEKTTIEIEDLEADVLQEMLRYVYAGKVDNIAKMASSLLAAADKYGLEGLKSTCEDTLCKSLTIENAVNTLILADLNRAEKLKIHVIGFIIAHAKDIVESPSYKLLADSHQLHLLAEVFHVLALQNN